MTGLAPDCSFRQEALSDDWQRKGDAAMSKQRKPPKQLLHLVFGGELASLDGTEFRDLRHLDIVGIYPNYTEAYAAWRAASHRTVDNAMMRYFIVHMHRLLDPDHPPVQADAKARS